MKLFKCSTPAKNLLGVPWVEERERQLIQEGRDKVENDLKIIRERQSLDPLIEPSPDLDPEEYLEKLQRNHVWEIVHGYLKPTDLSNVYFTCKTFQEYVEERRKITLFPEVLKVLLKKKFLRYDYFNGKDAATVKNLRLVSKKWKQATDKVLHDRIFTKPEWYLDSDWFGVPRFTVNSLEKIISATGVLNSPSLVRVLEFDWRFLSAADVSSFSSKLSDFLHVHGRHVWGIRLCAFNTDDTLERGMGVYGVLRTIFAKCRQLKALSLHFETGMSTRPGDTDEKKKLFLEHLHRNPLPTVTTLEYVGMNPKGSFKYLSGATPIGVEILRSCPNLKSLSLVSCVPQEFLNEIGMHHLERLYVKQEYPLQLFRKLENYTAWPLKVLQFYNSSTEQRVRMTSGTIFRIVNNFHDTLREIKLTGWDRLEGRRVEHIFGRRAMAMYYNRHGHGDPEDGGADADQNGPGPNLPHLRYFDLL